MIPVNEDLSFSEACELARLACELAQKRGTDDPRPFLVEAARLVEESRAVWRNEVRRVREAGRPKVRARAMLNAEIERLDRSCIALSELVNLGARTEKGKKTVSLSVVKVDKQGSEITKSVKWLQYKGEPGFRKLIRSYVQQRHTPENVRLGNCAPTLDEAVSAMMNEAKIRGFSRRTVYQLHLLRTTKLADRAAKGGQGKAKKRGGGG